MTDPHSLTTAMLVRVHKAILAAQGWLPFDQFMLQHVWSSVDSKPLF